jgi:hypothetical protein
MLPRYQLSSVRFFFPPPFRFTMLCAVSTVREGGVAAVPCRLYPCPSGFWQPTTTVNLPVSAAISFLFFHASVYTSRHVTAYVMEQFFFWF